MEINGGSRELMSAPQPGERRVAVIVAADVVGYTRLMEADESGIHARLMHVRTTVVLPAMAQHHGRIIKNTGDGFLAMFDDAAGAMRAAMEIQRSIMTSEAKEEANRRIAFRMGINVADVIVEDHDVYGDGVNVAARLQTHAEPHGIVVSGLVADAVGGTLGMHSVDLGQMYLRNREQPVRVLSLRFTDAPNRPIGDAEPGSEGRPTIAVLPFRRLMVAEDSYFADGIVDNIIQSLAALRELFVIARGSTLGFGDGPIDARAIGISLGVRYLLYCSVQRSGGRIRIGTELSDAETGEVLRADHYDGLLGELFQFQDRIAEETVKAIAPHVHERELKRAHKKHPQNMTAYDLVLQALEPMYRLDYASFSRARGLLQRAMMVDPGYAPAYSYAAWWHSGRISQAWTNNIAMDATEAVRLAQAALDREPNDALALTVYGHQQSYVRKEFDLAIDSFDRALTSCPNLALAWTLKGLTLCFIGDGPSALRCAQQGHRLSPRHLNIGYAEHIVAQAYYINGDFEQAISWSRRSIAHSERDTSSLRTLISSLVAIGAQEEACSVARRHREIAPQFSIREWAARSSMTESFKKSRCERLRAAGLPQ